MQLDGGNDLVHRQMAKPPRLLAASDMTVPGTGMGRTLTCCFVKNKAPLSLSLSLSFPLSSSPFLPALPCGNIKKEGTGTGPVAWSDMESMQGSLK
jgi:hypothetical protein